MDIRLDGQVALVTGGDSGIGRGIALLFAQAGAAVVVNYHEAEDKARQVVAEIEGCGGRAVAAQGDVSQEADVARMFDAAVSAFGGVDIPVANSGRQKDAPIADITLEQWQGVIDTNLTGQFLCARAAIRLFRSQGRRGVSKALGKSSA